MDIDEAERRRELKRLRNARYRAKQRGEVFDEETFIASPSQPRQAAAKRLAAYDDDPAAYEVERKGSIKEMVMIVGGGLVIVGGLFFAAMRGRS